MPPSLPNTHRETSLITYIWYLHIMMKSVHLICIQTEFIIYSSESETERQVVNSEMRSGHSIKPFSLYVLIQMVHATVYIQHTHATC